MQTCTRCTARPRPSAASRDHVARAMRRLRKGTGRLKLRSRDEDAHTALERIGCDPRFVRRGNVLAASENGRLDARARVMDRLQMKGRQLPAFPEPQTRFPG
jgi:hypothetical protein